MQLPRKEWVKRCYGCPSRFVYERGKKRGEGEGKGKEAGQRGFQRKKKRYLVSKGQNAVYELTTR